ncbi:ABC transporter permease [Porphyromonas crevioricanis]|uniref:ABC transporter permease n=1 Tax=Porphyromonas crevioricanis TaxID=393921 RepID=A0AB34PGF4_9PORP|nr:ABC transporter permease [Porphyromonas crevioricanis]KGN94334.1 ABC transporter permease [Porphyromonas crevioricanis]
MSNNKISVIIGREYAIRVRKKSFWIMTFLMPILFAAITVLPIFIAQWAKDEQKAIAIIDPTGEYLPLFHDNEDFRYVPADRTLEEYRDLASSKSDEEHVTAIVDISGPLLEGDSLYLAGDKLKIYSYKQLPSKLAGEVERTLETYLTNKRLDSYQIEGLKEMIEQSKVDLSIPTYKWGEAGNTERTSGDVAGIIGMVLTGISYMFIMMYGGMVLQGVLEEKKSRIMEVMVSSVKPFDMMMGKILGVGLVGLSQIFLWFVLTGILFFVLQFALLGGIYSANTLTAVQNPEQLGISSQMGMENFSQVQDVMSIIAGINFTEILTLFVLYFIGGYLLYAALFAAIGSAVSSDEDTNQFVIPVSILMLFSFYAAFGSRDNPDGPLAFWSSLFPFTSPVVMMVRLPYEVPLWQEILSIGLLFLTFVGVTWLASKIYRVGVLMYGKKPSFKEMWRWINYN